VVQVDLQGRELVALESLRVPRFVDILRFPDAGSGEVEQVEAALASHPFPRDLPVERQPYLEVAVRLARPDPGLRRRVEAALEGRCARLLKLTTEYPTAPGPVSGKRLEDLEPEGVFRERYRQQFDDEPPEPLVAAFHELLEDAQRSEA
jgi:exonuclease SbcD